MYCPWAHIGQVISKGFEALLYVSQECSRIYRIVIWEDSLFVEYLGTPVVRELMLIVSERG